MGPPLKPDKPPKDRPNARGKARVPRGAEFWEEEFRAHEAGWYFGGEPSTLARRLVHFFRMMEIPFSARLFDIGCGEGRDVVYFASLGFRVEAMEGAPTGVDRARSALEQQGMSGEVWQGDLASIDWNGSFDVVFANQSVQFAGAEALRILEEIRTHTRPGGFNAIGMFHRGEPGLQELPGVHYLEPGGLRRIYADWRLLEAGASTVWSPRRGKYLCFSNLIAQRPLS